MPKTSAQTMQHDDFDDPDEVTTSADDIDLGEEEARDAYFDLLARKIEIIQEELEAEINSEYEAPDAEDALESPEEDLAAAIETLSSLLSMRRKQLNRKGLPPHVDEKVEEYRD